jgi:hypothetical protein
MSQRSSIELGRVNRGVSMLKDRSRQPGYRVSVSRPARKMAPCFIDQKLG